MSRVERHAWFNVIIYLTGLAGLAILWPVVHGWVWWSCLIWGLVPFGVLFYCPFPGTSRPVCDERDIEIVRQALHVTHHVFWWAAAGGCWLPFLIYGTQGRVPAWVVSLYSLGAGLVWILIFSMRIIVLYRKDRHAQAA
jgi:hypothetical protein